LIGAYEDVSGCLELQLSAGAAIRLHNLDTYAIAPDLVWYYIHDFMMIEAIIIMMARIPKTNCHCQQTQLAVVPGTEDNF